jgi:dihydroorotate dehydrogenase electron transfer subunit
MSHRDTIAVEDTQVVSATAYDGDQYVLRLGGPRIAERAQPGCFIHVRCDERLPMRRPMSVMRVDRRRGEFEILFKVHGPGTRHLARCKPGDVLSTMGPIGVPFRLKDYLAEPLLIGGGVGIPPMVFLADHMRTQGVTPVVLMGSEVPFPFSLKPSTILVPGLPDGVIASMPLLDDWAVPCRLASQQEFAGCYSGTVTDLARCWIDARLGSGSPDIEIFACGPTPMLAAVATLAATYGFRCQLSVEEFMACAVGGCAGCTVRIRTKDGIAMKRVCVDGPVFEAATVVFD